MPLYRLLATPPEELRRRARRVARRLRSAGLEVSVVPTRGVIGGGSTPEQTLDSWGLALEGGNALATRLRTAHPATVVRLEENRVLVDLRAIFPEQDGALHDALVVATAKA